MCYSIRWKNDKKQEGVDMNLFSGLEALGLGKNEDMEIFKNGN